MAQHVDFPRAVVRGFPIWEAMSLLMSSLLLVPVATPSLVRFSSTPLMANFSLGHANHVLYEVKGPGPGCGPGPGPVPGPDPGSWSWCWSLSCYNTAAKPRHDLIHKLLCMDMHRSTLIYIYIYIYIILFFSPQH